MRRTLTGGLALAALAGSLALTSTASGAAAHLVQPGETLWSIAAANNLTTRTVAAYNGIAEDAQLIAGQTIEVPTVSEGATALAGGTSGASSTTSSSATLASPTTTAAPASWLLPVWTPSGTVYLASYAATSWNQMREASLRDYGVDLYPAGPLSAYRTYAQQSYLYDLYLSGQGAPANPPGTSSHETGLAVDVATPEMRYVIDQIGYAYGWGKAHGPDEWWHVDYVG
jgi:murein DD-endopeptidase MepM/ murein hydrolase activator NlpD